MTRLRLSAVVRPLLLAAWSAFANDPTYKVGDRVEALPYGTQWYSCIISQVKMNGATLAGYGVTCQKPDGTTMEWGVGSTPDYIRPDSGRASAEVSVVRAKAAALAQAGVGAPYGTRNPETCKSKKEPSKGAPSSEQARQLFACTVEGVSGGTLYLVEKVTIEVGKGTRFFDLAAGARPSDADRDGLIYPIRGSLRRYSCGIPSSILNNAGKNCTVFEEPKATGDCYRTSFGDWKCSMGDMSAPDKYGSRNVPPPHE